MKTLQSDSLITALLKNRKEISIADIQSEYGYSYATAEEYIQRLITTGKIDLETSNENRFVIKNKVNNKSVQFKQEKLDLDEEDLSLSYKKNRRIVDENCKYLNDENKEDACEIYDVIENLKESIDIIDDGVCAWHIRFRQNNENINLMLTGEGDFVSINDLGSTMEYMDIKYELNAKDVKMCISKIMKHYGVSLKPMGEVTFLHKEIYKSEDAWQCLIDFYNCMVVLKEMYLFFNEPNT